ncbi:DUF4350 domain-containing protein [Pseudomonas sp. GD03944]|uniref:DUF4350 domain-containing protein n=1 Tax=Pseudomonas sp. GD03944 TaxID=2975409 RepID=UPI00244ACFC3|nr:DUF4350 domain-containing protein [Pseudomonas sp. GD03944]MDH1265368.1 DUF4350 domain-containing protein [Pseudomonas sp. GD03944]
MNRRTQLGFGLAVLLVLGVFGAYLLSLAEPYEEEVKHGPAPEARANPYLAAEHFLRRQGLDVTRASGLDVLPTLPSKDHTLLLLGNRRDLTPRQSARLLEWAEKGGHLVFVAERLWDEDDGESGDLLLDSLGIQQYESDELELPSEDEATDEDDAQAEANTEQAEPEPYAELTQLYLENEEAPAYINFDTRYHLYDAENRAHAWANSGDATHLLQLYHGAGLVTVLSDAWIWQTFNIAQYDNAWLLWYLGQDSAVTLLYRADRDDLFSLLLRHFGEALAALGLLIVAGLWFVGMRQGPLQIPASPSRRQLQEHLRASADFLLRRSGQHSLLHSLQQDIQRRARRRHPGFERLGVAEQWQVLGRLTRLPSSAISQAMRPLPKQRLAATEFTRQVAHLQTLRNAL